MNEEQKLLLVELGKNQYGAALKAFLNVEYEKINDIQTTTSWEETIGRQLALKTLDKLFNFMGERKTSGKSPRHEYV